MPRRYFDPEGPVFTKMEILLKIQDLNRAYAGCNASLPCLYYEKKRRNSIGFDFKNLKPFKIADLTASPRKQNLQSRL